MWWGLHWSDFRHVPCVLKQIQIWGSIKAYVSFLGPFLSSLCCVAGHIVLLGRHCHLGLVLQLFPRRTWHCNKLINVIHVTCQWLYRCGWLLYMLAIFDSSFVPFPFLHFFSLMSLSSRGNAQPPVAPHHPVHRISSQTSELRLRLSLHQEQRAAWLHLR